MNFEYPVHMYPLTGDLMPLSWNFCFGCLHLELCVACIKLCAYVKKKKRTLQKNEVKQQVSTCVWIIPLFFFKPVVTKTTVF